jgi:MinD superfamily P-loop ATPase
MGDDCKINCELGAIKQFCESQGELNKTILKKLDKIDADLNDGLKTDMAVVKEHCKAHDREHKGLTVRTAVLALLFLVPIAGLALALLR